MNRVPTPASARRPRRAGTPGGRGARAYALLTRLYPPPFRSRYATSLLADFAALSCEQRHRGVLGRLALWRLILADVAASAAAEWRDLAVARLTAGGRPSAPLPTGRPGATGGPMESFVQDVRFALRSLRRSPGFVVVVMLSLGLGIGANTLIYSVVDGVVLRPFPYPEADRLVAVGVTFPKLSGERRFIETLSPPEYLDIRDGARSLERLVAFDLGNRNLTGGDRPERVFTAFVWGDPFATIGIAPALGRGFRTEETTTPGSDVVVLSHRVWRSRFGGDSSLVGRAVQVNGVALTVVGIMPPTLLLAGTDLWMPMATAPTDIPRQARQFALLGRLRDGSTLRDANTELALLAARVTQAHRAERPEYEGWRLEVTPWAEAVTDRYRTAAFLLQGAVLLVLLIACANVAGLLVSRAAMRHREIALRRALGAAGRRLTRQLLTESVILAVAGGALGVVLALLLTGPVSAAFPALVTSMGIEVRLNGRVLLTALLLSVAVGLLFGMAPALQLLRRATSSVLDNGGGRMTVGRTGRRVRAAFLVGQLALSLVLLAGAGILVRSLTALQRVELGVSPARVLTMRLSLPQERYTPERVSAFFEELSTRLRAVPGVREASAATQYAPLNGFEAPLALEGETPAEGAARMADVTNVTRSHFRTMGYEVKRGRLFEAGDTRTAPSVAVINETAARRYFAGASPVGERVRLGEGAEAPQVEIVGVVRDARNRGLDAPVAPEVFIPVDQQRARYNNQLFVLVRTQGDPMALLPAVREVISAMDAQQPVYSISTLERDVGSALVARRGSAFFLAVFAVIAVFLAAIGIYGLVSHGVAERVREIGIRMALGAGAGEVRWLIMRQTMTLVGVGAALGIAGAIAAGGALRRLAYGVSPTDAPTIAVVTVILLAVGVVATAIPTRRATRITPTLALREE